MCATRDGQLTIVWFCFVFAHKTLTWNCNNANSLKVFDAMDRMAKNSFSCAKAFISIKKALNEIGFLKNYSPFISKHM